MSLSSINFSSYQNAISTAYSRPATTATHAADVANVANVIPISSSAGQPSSVATGLGGLLISLAAGDIGGSQTSLNTLAENLRSTQASADSNSGLGAGFSRLLTRLGATLDSGETTTALAQIQYFLLGSGQAAGTAFSATV